MADTSRRQEVHSTRSLIDKLGVKPFHRISVIGVDDDVFWAQLIDRAADTVKGRLRKESDLIFFAAGSLPELQHLARLKSTLVSKDDPRIYTNEHEREPLVTIRVHSWIAREAR